MRQNKVVNLFVNGVYIVPYATSSMNYDPLLPVEYKKEADKINKSLRTLHKKMSDDFPVKKTYKEELDLASIMTFNLSITFKPLDPHFMIN